MTISIWRYSHLTLAISSALFIVIASITGIILAFEPISEKLNSFNVVYIDDVSISETLFVLQQKYDEIITLEIDENDFVSANVVLENGKNETFYINPKTGNKIGEILKKKPIFEFVTNLHRSLFLKSTGRFMIGFVSFLLFLIAFTGLLLIVKRQGGFLKVFSKVVKEDFNQYYHVIIGRYALIPIIIITITGVYLSLEKFSLLPKDTFAHQNIQQNKVTKIVKPTDFKIFKETKLSEIQKIEFPFSADEEDYFFVKLANKEVAIHQLTGEIISEKTQSLVNFGSYYSLLLHTGKGSILWSTVLLLTCVAIMFFVFSGFSMALTRKKKAILIKNKFKKDEAEYIILVGSETGTTFKFANAFYDALLFANKTVFLSELNAYATYEKAKNIIIFTSTYGDGEAPLNANKFLQKIDKIPQRKVLQFSVIGFGSVAYKYFCKYAILVQANLQIHQKFVPVSPVFKVNNQSFSDFNKWLKEWSSFNKIELKIEKESLQLSKKDIEEFMVLDKTDINKDATFLVTFKPNKKTTFESGDLLSITPKNENRSRLYSIAKINDSILLSIKKHELGFCSSYLNQLNVGDKIRASIQKNKKFHFPKKAKEVILIANGTGIAPFLGMIKENKKNIKIHLFWGGKTKKSFEIYKDYIDSSLKNKALTSFYTAFSQEQKEKIYVQDMVKKQAALFSNTLKNGNVIMICGSLSMQKGVTKVLQEISENHLKSSLKTFEENDQIQTDCY
jgi:sulfite reductase (NADPH) flavoprotein alpha-component